MKGITHFTVGVAAASCLPAAVEAGAAGNPLYFILGGICGLLPDTLDFKLCRFLCRHDVEIRPDPLKFDSEMIAEGVADTVNAASARRLRLKLSTVELDDERWQSYRIGFDTSGRRVVVAKGPVVDLSGNAVEMALDEPEAVAALEPDIRLEYFATVNVDIFDGPALEFVPLNDGRQVKVKFLPWHRAWTHSLVLGLFLGLAGWLLLDVTAGIVVSAACSLHVLVDQMGFMGCNLWFPFTKERRQGAMRMQSGNAACNAAAVWASCLLIFWNLYSAAGWEVQGFTAIRLFFYGAFLPGVGYWWIKRRMNHE